MRKKYYSGGPAKAFKKILEKAGGDEKAKPHSTKKGRIASGARRLARIVKSKTKR